MSETLCWYCKKACGDCSWSDHHEPIEGWNAKTVPFLGNTGKTTTFEVDMCPEFLPDQSHDKKVGDYFLDIDTGEKMRSYDELYKYYGMKSETERKRFADALHYWRRERKMRVVRFYNNRFYEFGRVGRGRNVECVSTGKFFPNAVMAAEWLCSNGKTQSTNIDSVRKHICRAASEQGKERFFIYGYEWRYHERNKMLDV